MIDGQDRSEHFHAFVDPQSVGDPKYSAIHSLSDEFLRGQRTFQDVVPAFLNFVTGARLIMHYAVTDLAFLTEELTSTGWRPIQTYIEGVTGTWEIARRLWPERTNTLFELCDRLEVNLPASESGAMLDAIAVATVYTHLVAREQH